MPTATARLVPGEIMTAPLPCRPGSDRDGAIDAEFETIGPAVAFEGRAAGGRRVAGAALPERPRHPARPGGTAFWVLGSALVASAFWMSGGYRLAERLDVAPAARLAIGGVEARIDRSGAKPVLAVDGHVRNDGRAGAALVALSMQIIAEDGSIMRYRLGTTTQELAPGQRYAFSSRLAVPKSGVKAVAVQLAN